MTTQKTQRPKPVYAVAAVGDLAVEQLKKLPETASALRTRVETEFSDLQAKIKKVDLTEVRGKVQTQVNELPEKVKDLRGKVRTELDSLTDKVKTEVSQLRHRVEDVRSKRVGDLDKFRTNAQDTANDFVDSAQKQLKAATKQATEVYEGLVSRGVKVLDKPAPAAKKAVETPAAPKATKATKATKKTTAAK